MTRFVQKALIVLVAGILSCPFSYANPERTVLIEGVGGYLTTNYLTPAILRTNVLTNTHFTVKFYGTELCTEALSDNSIAAIEQLNHLGMKFLDKSDSEQLRKYRSLTPDYVFLATPPSTHIPLVKMWLERDYTPKEILVEKPFTENIEELKDFIEYLNERPDLKNKVKAFDLADIACGLHGSRLEKITTYLGSIDEIVVYWLQNNSGEIINNTKLLSTDNRPISRENRVAALQEGMIYDSLIHLFPIIHNVVDLKKVEVTDIKAAQYENAEIRGDTFVATRMLIENRRTNKQIPVTMYAGKGIGEVQNLQIKRNGKHLVMLHNKSGRRVLLNLDTSLFHYIDVDGKSIQEFSLPINYEAVIENLFLRDGAMGEPVESALLYLGIATEIKEKINDYLRYNSYPKYHVGTRSKPAPSLEQVLLSIDRAYGEGSDKLRNVSIQYTG